MAKKRKKSAKQARTQGELSEGELAHVAGGAIYMKIPEVDGPTTDTAHKDQIEIESFSFGIAQTGGQTQLGLRKK